MQAQALTGPGRSNGVIDWWSQPPHGIGDCIRHAAGARLPHYSLGYMRKPP